MSKPRYIIISGIGLISPLGYSAWETFANLLSGMTLPDRMRELPDNLHPIEIARVTGSIGISHGSSTDPAVELAERAIREACTQAQVRPEGLPVITGASKGAVTNWHKEPLNVVLGSHGYWAWELTRRLKLGSVKNIVAACASGLYAVHHARQMLLAGKAKRVLVVTAEAALLPHFIASYNALGSSPNSPRKITSGDRWMRSEMVSCSRKLEPRSCSKRPTNPRQGNGSYAIPPWHVKRMT